MKISVSLPVKHYHHHSVCIFYHTKLNLINNYNDILIRIWKQIARLFDIFAKQAFEKADRIHIKPTCQTTSTPYDKVKKSESLLHERNAKTTCNDFLLQNINDSKHNKKLKRHSRTATNSITNPNKKTDERLMRIFHTKKTVLLWMQPALETQECLNINELIFLAEKYFFIKNFLYEQTT